MRTSTLKCLAISALAFSCASCQMPGKDRKDTSKDAATATVGQSGVQDDVSQKDVVKVAMGSPDHSTLVTALKAADYVDVLSNAGPFTVFAPTDAAFARLPEGTLQDLLKPEKKDDLRSILEYHVYVGRLTTEMLQDGQVLGQASGHNAVVAVKYGQVSINGAKVLESIPASNGIIHVVDAVLIPPKK